MYSFELFEAGKPRVVVTYPGRFQPFHQGHAAVFAKLQKQFGLDNVYILTSNDTSSAKSPFNFSDKYRLMTAASVPGDKIIETNNMYVLPEGFDPGSTIFVTAVGEPDKKRLSVDSFTKTDRKDKEGNVIKPAGSASYFKSFESPENKVTADQHGYVVVIPEVQKSITIGGKSYDVSHGTECRNLWNVVRNNPEQRREFLTQLYGSADPELGRIFDKIPRSTSEDISPAGQDSTSPITGNIEEDAAGVGVVATNKKMAKDPRYSMSITQDVKPSTPKDMLRAFRLAEQDIDPADFEIRNFEKLDRILIDCCEMVIEGQKENNNLYGMVAACVLDPENRAVYGINTFDDATDTRKHAERVAIENYTKQFGDIPKGSIIITTLSPCCHPMEERYGESCTDLINQSGVHKVYCGYKDPTQEPEDKVFHVMCTRNEKIKSICKKFADTFLKENTNKGEKSFPAVIQAIQKAVPAAEEIWFHGSRATGKHKRTSDWDILVVVPKDLVGPDYIDAVFTLQDVAKKFPNFDIQPTKTDSNLYLIAQEEGKQLWSKTDENFADGRNPQDKGDSRRYGIPKHAKISTLRKIAKQGGRKGQLAHWQANMRSGREKTNESVGISEDDMMGMIKKFLPLAMKELNLKKLPRIIIQQHVDTHDGQATFGRFVNEEEAIYLGIADRHPVDILRTLAHELTHFRQFLDGEMYHGAGETGSPIENEAHIKAGIIMRHFNKKYPKAVSAPGLDLPSDRDNS